MSTYLSRDQILTAVDVRTEDVEVPEWGGTVRVRGMSGAQRDRFEAQLMDIKQAGGGGKPTSAGVNSENFRAKLAAACLVDDKDEPLFTEKHVRVLGTKSGAALDRIMPVAMRLSGLSDKDATELEGN